MLHPEKCFMDAFPSPVGKLCRIIWERSERGSEQGGIGPVWQRVGFSAIEEMESSMVDTLRYGASSPGRQ